ncbi:MAG TPA: hypothetical protein VJV78_21020 [Polyangiales bacterium]|nr:hypothetical protein [Polyangiales bacterium]
MPAKFNEFVCEAAAIVESLEAGARGLWRREHRSHVRGQERERITAAWAGKHYTRCDLDFEVEKRVAARCEDFVTLRIQLLLHAMHACNAQLLDDSELALPDEDAPVDPPRSAHLRLLRGAS